MVYLGHPYDNPVMLGRDAVVFWNPVFPVFPEVLGELDDTNIAVWMNAALPANDMFDIAVEFVPEFVDTTTRKLVNYPVRDMERVTETATVSFSVPHYRWDTEAIKSLTEQPYSSRFPIWMQSRVCFSRLPVGLAICEQDVPPNAGTAGFVGNFKFRMTSTSTIRGIQLDNYVGVADGFFDYREDIVR